MTQFWIAAVVLVLFALMFVLVPLLKSQRLRKQQQNQQERKAQNIAIFRDRLAELEADLAEGQLDAEQFATLKAELQLSLLQDVDASQAAPVSPAQGKRLGWLVALLVIVIPLAALGFYRKWGAYGGLEEQQLMAQVEAAQQAGDAKQLVQQLQSMLKDHPENPEIWYMLARTQMNLGQHKEAADAFLHLAKLLDNNPVDAASIWGLYAQALYFANDGKLDQQVHDAIKQAFARNPNELNSLGLLGIEAFEHGQYPQAARYWQKILDTSPDNPNIDSIRAGIQRAHELMAQNGQQPLPDETAATPVASGSGGAAPSLKVSVALDPQLAAKADPNDTLFIYARAVNGPRMPLAIVRKQVKDLPLTVVLDDSKAMGPMAKLSSVPQVDVIARISKQGTPAPNPGDLEGVLTPIQVKPGEQTLELKIAKEVE